MIVTPMTMMVFVDLLLFGLFRLLAAFLDDFDVIVEDGGDDRDHVGFNDPCPNGLGASDSYVHNTLESQIPLPHVHHVLAPALLQDAYQPLDASIDGEDVSDASRRGGEIGQMIKRVNQRQGRGAIESTSIIQGGRDSHRRLVDVGDAEVDFPHLVPSGEETRRAPRDGGMTAGRSVSVKMGAMTVKYGDSRRRAPGLGRRRWARLRINALN